MGESRSKGEQQKQTEQPTEENEEKKERIYGEELKVRGDENQVEGELNGEKVLMIKEVLDLWQQSQKSDRPILPPVKIEEPTQESTESYLQMIWRENEEQN